MDRKSKFVANGTIGGMEASNDLEEELDEAHSVFCTTNISTCHPINQKGDAGKFQHIVCFVLRNELMQLFATKKHLSAEVSI